MKHIIRFIVVWMLFWAPVSSLRAEEYSVRFYDDSDGLSHWHISQTLQDSSGMVWVATWNGLNRFDGHHFVPFKPELGSAAFVPNDRIRRMRLTPDNKLLCLIEERVFSFDTRACRFDTLPVQEEEEAYTQLHQRFNPDFDRQTAAKHKQYGNVELSNVWEEYTDRQGNRWLYDDHGVYVVSPIPSRGRIVYRQEVRAVHRMRNGDIWASGRDQRQLIVFDSTLCVKGYIAPNGNMQCQPVSFGNMVYCIHELSDGRILLGCKPGHVIALPGLSGGSIHSYPELRNAYDIAEDPEGHIWVATFGFGLWRSTRFSSFELVPGTEGLKIRRILFAPDGTLLAATTEGVLTVIGDQAILHQRQADKNPLSSNAIMCLCLFNGRLYAGTEGGGLNRLKNNIHDAEWEWEHWTTKDGLESDIIFELLAWSDTELLIQGSNSFSLFRPETEHFVNYGRSFFGGEESKLVLGEVPPVALNDSEVLVAPTQGMVVLDKHKIQPDSTNARIALCSITRNGEVFYGVDDIERITLGPSERNLVMTFATLDYRNNGGKRYSTRLFPVGQEDAPWSSPTSTNEVIMQNLRPGEYIFEIRATNAYGHWQANTRRIHLSIQPTFLESKWGQTLLVCLLLLIALSVTVAFLQARFSRKKRAETLKAYLELQERMTHMEKQQSAPLNIPEILAPGYTSENERFLNTLHRFMEKNIGNCEMNIDDLAKEENMSRSTLNRKMHELFNLSAKDFVQAARIKHACQLLRNTDISTKEVAYACGFSDPNYFSKCFKANMGQTPTEYREGQ